jgi:hypothetical protein
MPCLQEDESWLQAEPEVDMTPEEETTYAKRAPQSGTRACKPRGGKPFSKQTGGALWAFCACGYIVSVMELPQAESTRMVALFLMRIFKGATDAASDRRVPRAWRTALWGRPITLCAACPPPPLPCRP